MSRVESPPFGMDKEATQIPTASPHYFNIPDGRPLCYVKSTKPCRACPYKWDCANAEGRT